MVSVTVIVYSLTSGLPLSSAKAVRFPAPVKLPAEIVAVIGFVVRPRIAFASATVRAFVTVNDSLPKPVIVPAVFAA